jgi:cation diffusion facilitator family transporter
VAGAARESLLTRASEVSSVLYRVLFLNLIVAAAKIALGLSTGAVSVLSDGYHSLTDTASNIVGIVGVRIAGAPPDVDHPYGHRKFETISSLGILIFLIIVLREVLSAAWERYQTGGEPVINALTFGVMGATFLVNLGVVFYERREGRRLASEVLLADAHHTLSDLMTSATVIAALIGVRMGYLWLDPFAALVVAGFIGYACWEIFNQTTGILADKFVIPEESISEEVKSVPGVIGCHHIRTRGSNDFVFLDLHVWMDAEMSLTKAHALSHVVKDRLMQRFPQIKDAIIHIEPPPKNLQEKGRKGDSGVR